VSDRFCPQCRSEVEDAGGFCLLGHPLRSVAPVASLSELRAEVDRAFEEARVQVARALGEAPAPPPLPRAASAVVTVELDAPGVSDPITEFAPAPRMDWGPEKQGLLKRRG
jgi:hypothetical protein